MDNQSDKYATILRLEQDGDDMYYVAEHPEIEGCFSDGETPEEAFANLAEVTEMILDHLRTHNLPIPEPRPIIVPRKINITSRSFRETPEDSQPRLEITLLVPA